MVRGVSTYSSSSKTANLSFGRRACIWLVSALNSESGGQTEDIMWFDWGSHGSAEEECWGEHWDRLVMRQVLQRSHWGSETGHWAWSGAEESTPRHQQPCWISRSKGKTLGNIMFAMPPSSEQYQLNNIEVAVWGGGGGGHTGRPSYLQHSFMRACVVGCSETCVKFVGWLLLRSEQAWW